MIPNKFTGTSAEKSFHSNDSTQLNGTSTEKPLETAVIKRKKEKRKVAWKANKTADWISDSLAAELK